SGALTMHGATAINCRFFNNRSSTAGAIRTLEGPNFIINCVFSGNTATFGGGAVEADYSPSQIVNCTFYGTSAPRGGALRVGFSASLNVSNCIIWGNNAPLGPQILIENGTLVVGYSDVQGGWGGTGNINADPLFTDATNVNFTLQAISPCIDSGSND